MTLLTDATTELFYLLASLPRLMLPGVLELRWGERVAIVCQSNFLTAAGIEEALRDRAALVQRNRDESGVFE